MAGFSADMLRTVDQMITARRDRITAVGTVSARPATRTANTLSVTFDGSTLAVPVKKFAGVIVRENDRVGLVKFGNEWIVVGSWTAFDYPEQGYIGVGTVGTTASATYAATPGGESISFTKAFDDTKVRMAVDVGAYAGGAFRRVMFGLRFVEIATTYDVAHLEIADNAKHTIVSGHRIQSGIAAGVYTVALYWRAPGSTTVQMDSNDEVCFSVAEIGP